MNMEVPEGDIQADPVLKPQWSRGRAWLTAVGFYLLIVAVVATLLWLSAFSPLGGWGLALSIGISLLGVALFFGAMLIIGVVTGPFLKGTGPL